MFRDNTLVGRLTKVGARLSVLPDRLGHPGYRTIVLRRDNVYTELLPRPQITQVDPRKIGTFLSDNVEIVSDDLVVSGIPRTYDQDLLASATYLLDAELQPDGPWVGQRAEVIYLDKSDLITYSVTIRRARGR